MSNVWQCGHCRQVVESHAKPPACPHCGQPLPPTALPPALCPSTYARQTHVITRRSVASWVLYDLGNTIFSMNIVSLYFSLYVQEQEEVGPSRVNWVYGLTTAISMGIIFVLSPVLGALTDHAPRRIPFLIVSTVVCIVFTMLLGAGGLLPSLVFFVIANVGYQAGLQFYDALLPEVSTEANRGWIGGIAIGIGYTGSYIGIGTGLLMLQVFKTGKPALFQVTALLFLLFALPAFVWIKERGNPSAKKFTWGAVRAAVRQVTQTLKHSRRYPGLLRFLIGRMFYTDAINTVIMIMGLYVTNLATRAGLTKAAGESYAQWIMLVSITFAIMGGLVWGKITDRIGPKRTLTIVLRLWMCVYLAAALMGLLMQPLHIPLGCFYVIACATGLALSGTWTADRPYMLRLTPPARIGEFYGLYGMVGRFSAITGPLLWSLIVGWLFARRPDLGQPMGVLAMLVLVLVSYFILRPVSDHRREWSGPDVVNADPAQ
jgi:MFS transporter, UMF1 family